MSAINKQIGYYKPEQFTSSKIIIVDTLDNQVDTKDFEKYCTLAVRALDNLLDYQDYPIKAAEKGTMNRRPLGIGIINLAFWMAKNGMTYTQPNLEMIDTFAEAWSYYLIKASADLAEEQGACLWSDQTKYHNGLTPNQTYKQDVDELVAHKERMPWRELRDQLKRTGIRNSTLMALMPAETSAQISNATNGIEPPRSLVSVKQSKHGVLTVSYTHLTLPTNREV